MEATMTDEDSTRKEKFFDQIGALADQMIAAYGPDFAMGALIVAARAIAQRQSRDDPQAGALVNADGNAISSH
jgi:hypothetical protein